MTAITTAQIVNAQGNDDGKGKSDDAYGNDYMKNNAQCAKEGGNDCNQDDDKNWGEGISEGADNDAGIPGKSEDYGLGDFRADGCKGITSPGEERHGNSGICD
jgi:hypothetical protein